MNYDLVCLILITYSYFHFAVPCGSNEFACKSGYGCLNESLRCDSKLHCLDESDELQCGNVPFQFVTDLNLRGVIIN